MCFIGQHTIRQCNVYSLIILIILLGISSVSSDPIASGKQKFLGNVTGSNPPADFSTYWNQITPENSGKWGVVEQIRNEMKWEAVQKAYDFAKQNGYPFKQHTFVWGRQEPQWIKDLTPEEQKAEIEEFIRLYAEKFPETDFVDVVNEPLNDPASYREALGGAGTTGWDWVIWAFQKAREYLPKTKLLLNEYNIINDNAMTDKYLEIINLLKERNLIDAIGDQAHCFNLQESKPEILKGNLDRLAATGLPLYITELDLEGNDTLQLQRYQKYFPVLWEHPAVKGVTLWGYRYKRTWKETTWLLDSIGGERPALTWLREYVATHSSVLPKKISRKHTSSEIFINNTMIQTAEKKPVLIEIFTVNGKKAGSVTVTGSVPVSYFNLSGGSYIIRANRLHLLMLYVAN
ncbi:MAG: endo-1,4-beta-xylanase [Chitinispirillaceae bacterium]|nr:endo-1,4-beta-xylanase [Chitinispirillaceae bacterium]